MSFCHRADPPACGAIPVEHDGEGATACRAPLHLRPWNFRRVDVMGCAINDPAAAVGEDLCRITMEGGSTCCWQPFRDDVCQRIRVRS